MAADVRPWVGVGVGVDGGGDVAVAVEVTGAGVGVFVAGGVTCKINFWSGRRIEDEFKPFQAISSFTLISYRLAIHDNVSPLATS